MVYYLELVGQTSRLFFKSIPIIKDERHPYTFSISLTFYYITVKLY